MEQKLKQRICIEFFVKLQISATEPFEMLYKAFPNDAPKRTTVFEWHSRFKADDPETKRQSVEWRGQDIAPNDFLLFPKLKAVLKGRHFDNRDDILENSLLALKSIPKEANKNCFDNRKKRWRWRQSEHTITLPGVIYTTILLGLRTAIPNDSNHSIAQVVYGNNIRLPGEFFVEPDSYLTQEEYVYKLQKQMENFGPRPKNLKTNQNIFVHKNLRSCSHVFLRTDRVKKALEPPYEGPFQVLRREEKYFIIKIKNKEVSVSIDRLKPAYLLNTSQPEESAKDNTSIRQPVEPPVDIRRTSTRTGRTIKPPVRFQDYQT
ncbi:hypothetical protein LAZ67_4001365 [Cordylochernes scorpioides]|uniref:Mos1 transposase HTH domain-containing protein n=1 Tax=Cordylochernes scorpioides TaxID=51811 RepID=A0ABY6KD58_9ARAC|nr:hypothetical protein LAZ67_4001365 [Cordylochernes scorpioides]